VIAMMKPTLLLIAATAALQAQQPVAPTNEPVGPARGENSGNYNITNSFEFGYRWSIVGGDLGEYRSDVNYSNGLRLLSSGLSVDSKDGRGRYFDQILLNTQGLGNDPYQNAILRIQKNGLYRYDMTWRLDAYYNPGLTVAGGLHLMDTVRRLQDHDFTLFPQGHYRLRIGYSRNTQDGPTLSTSEEFDNNSTGLPVFANVRRQWNEYRLGGDIDTHGFRFTVLRRWDFFKEDTPYSLAGVVSAADVVGSSTTDLTVLQQFNKSAPVHGRNPGWLGNLTATHKRWALNARMSYTGGHNAFALGEIASGLNRFGAATNRQIAVLGDASRPFVAGDFNISLFPTKRLTVVHNISVNNLRISGPSSYSEVVDGINTGETIFFRYLGILNISDATDINYRLKDWFGVYAGYRYTHRLVRTIEGFSLPAFANSTENDVYENNNYQDSGLIGLRFRPIKPLSINLESEIGRANHPLTPISDRNYHALGGRIDYRTRKVTFSTQYHQFYNVNAPVFYSAFSSHSRNYTATASWAARNWFSLDASYMKLHWDSIGGIAFFAGGVRPTLQSNTSLYISNTHAGTLAARFSIGRRIDAFIGYSITKDTGDGRSTATDGVVSTTPPDTTSQVNSLLASVQTFPLSYQSPFGRISLRLTPKMRWNVGWQFYNYHEQFEIFNAYQNFHANTGYTSVLWSF
jgi:hypothetical protein